MRLLLITQEQRPDASCLADRSGEFPRCSFKGVIQMKRIILGLCIFSMLLCFTACDDKLENNGPDNEKEI